jgi:hypothetical protein
MRNLGVRIREVTDRDITVVIHVIVEQRKDTFDATFKHFGVQVDVVVGCVDFVCNT